jgi:hypothetical protein
MICNNSHCALYREIQNLKSSIYLALLVLWGSKEAGLAQSVERQALNLVVVGSSPTAGEILGREYNA